MVFDSLVVKIVCVIEIDLDYEVVVKKEEKFKIEKKKCCENFVVFKKVNDKGKILLKVLVSC